MTKKWWCITDFEEKFVLLQVGSSESNEELPSKYKNNDTFIVATNNFDESQLLWSNFNEIQFSEIPKNLQELRSILLISQYKEKR